MATKKKAPETKATTAKATAKAATKSAAKATSKAAAPRGNWNKRWIGREIAITLMDDSLVVGTLREIDDWALCISLSEEPGAETIIPREGIVLMEYSPTGYDDWFADDDSEELITANNGN